MNDEIIVYTLYIKWLNSLQQIETQSFAYLGSHHIHTAFLFPGKSTHEDIIIALFHFLSSL
jgi:hypothetical protein